jgi:hypothetical protein
MIEDSKKAKKEKKKEEKLNRSQTSEGMSSMIGLQKRKMSIAHNVVLDPNRQAAQDNILSPPKLNKF